LQEPKDAQIEKLLELLERCDDEKFEAFCEALIESENKGVVTRYFQEYRVCCVVLNFASLIFNYCICN